MISCSICKTKAKNKNQDYCLTCAWEFEYYFDELSIEEKNRYSKRAEIFKLIYEKSINSSEMKSLQKKFDKKEESFNELEKRYLQLEKQIKENSFMQEDIAISLLAENTKKSDIKSRFLNKSIWHFIWNSIVVLFRVSILLAAFTLLMVFTYTVGGKELGSSIANSIVAIEGFLFLWVVIRELKRLLIKKELVKSDEKSPIFYFIGTWIGFIIYIPLEILKYLFIKVRK